jgi:hypothetical protein
LEFAAMMRGVGLILTLFLAVMLAQAVMAGVLVLCVIGLAIGLIFNTKRTLELLSGLIAIALFSSYPIPCIVVLVLALIIVALPIGPPPAG